MKNKNNKKNVTCGGRPLRTQIWRKRECYLLILPALIYLLIFHYGPLYGIQIAFKNYKMSIGIWNSKWVGFRHFKDFFTSYNFWTLLRNTVVLATYNMVVSFPFPIIVALILNELTPKFKRTVQTILYAPHFLSLVVFVGMILNMLSPSRGVINTFLGYIGVEPIYFMGKQEWFRHIYVFSGVWKSMGWSSILYIAALSGVDPNLHEAAKIDGASRVQIVRHINFPSILPTITLVLIMNVGNLVSVGHEKIYLLQNAMNLDVSEVISTYVYKRGLVNANYSFSTAVGLFNNIVNVTLVLIANAIAKKTSETSLF